MWKKHHDVLAHSQYSYEYNSGGIERLFDPSKIYVPVVLWQRKFLASSVRGDPCGLQYIVL